MVDFVACGFQVVVEAPSPFRSFWGDGPVDHHDRILASAARPESVLLLVQPGFPLGLQRAAHPLLLGAICDNGNSERAFLSAFFGMCTRRTGSARPGPPWRCSRIARLARSSEVSATCLSTPGVWRP